MEVKRGNPEWGMKFLGKSSALNSRESCKADLTLRWENLVLCVATFCVREVVGTRSVSPKKFHLGGERPKRIKGGERCANFFPS